MSILWMESFFTPIRSFFFLNKIISKNFFYLIYFSIMELENARDDLMFEVHKLNSDRREYDKNVIIFVNI